MRKWSDVTLSNSWISSINVLCITETSRELWPCNHGSASFSPPCPWEWVASIPMFLLWAESKGLSPVFVSQAMAGIKGWNYLHTTLSRATLFSATILAHLSPTLHSSCWFGLTQQEITLPSHLLQGATEERAVLRMGVWQREQQTVLR